MLSHAGATMHRLRIAPARHRDAGVAVQHHAAIAQPLHRDDRAGLERDRAERQLHLGFEQLADAPLRRGGLVILELLKDRKNAGPIARQLFVRGVAIGLVGIG